MCGDYEIGVTPNVCSDSYPILNVEVTIGRNVFTKIDLKIANHEKDNNF